MLEEEEEEEEEGGCSLWLSERRLLLLRGGGREVWVAVISRTADAVRWMRESWGWRGDSCGDCGACGGIFEEAIAASVGFVIAAAAATAAATGGEDSGDIEDAVFQYQ